MVKKLPPEQNGAVFTGGNLLTLIGRSMNKSNDLLKLYRMLKQYVSNQEFKTLREPVVGGFWEMVVGQGVIGHMKWGRKREVGVGY